MLSKLWTGIQRTMNFLKERASSILGSTLTLLKSALDAATAMFHSLKEWVQKKLPNIGPIGLTGAAALTFSRAAQAIAMRTGVIMSLGTAAILGLTGAVLLSTI